MGHTYARPDEMGNGAMLQCAFPDPVVMDLVKANEIIDRLQATSEVSITSWSIPLALMDWITISDSSLGHVGVRAHQEYMVGITSPLLRRGKLAKVSWIGWKGWTEKRAVNSTLYTETCSLSATLAEVEWRKTMVSKIINKSCTLRH